MASHGELLGCHPVASRKARNTLDAGVRQMGCDTKCTNMIMSRWFGTGQPDLAKMGTGLHRGSIFRGPGWDIASVNIDDSRRGNACKISNGMRTSSWGMGGRY